MKSTAQFKTSIPARSTMRIFLEPAGGAKSPIYCSLIGIERGQIHLNTQKWLEPGTRAVLKIDGISVTGEIDYCNRKKEEYRTCFTVGHRRSAPRFPINEPGTLTVLGEEQTHSSACSLTDLSVSGLGLTTSMEVTAGSMICVQTGSMLAVGEVRHCRQDSAGMFRVGVEVTDVLSNEAARRARKGFRQRLAELILGYQIGPLQARQ